MVRISDSLSDWQYSLTLFVGQPFRKKNDHHHHHHHHHHHQGIDHVTLLDTVGK